MEQKENELQDYTDIMKDESSKKTHNPILRRISLSAELNGKDIATEIETIHKGGFLIVVTILSACASLFLSLRAVVAVGAAILAFCTGLRISSHPEEARWLAPVYALLEGLVLGWLSLITEIRYPGIVIKSLEATLGISAVMAIIFSSGWINVNKRFKSVVFVAMLGVFLLYITDIILTVGFGINVSFLHDTGWKGIVTSLIIITVAAMNLLWDYEEIHSLTKKGLPKEYEWYCAFGLVLTLFWLYLECLCTLRKLLK